MPRESRWFQIAGGAGGDDTSDVVHRDEDGFVLSICRAGRVVPVAAAIEYQLPVAFVVPRPGAKPSEDALRRYALDNGPAYAHPRAVWFVDERPLTGINDDRATGEARPRHQYSPGSHVGLGIFC